MRETSILCVVDDDASFNSLAILCSLLLRKTPHSSRKFTGVREVGQSYVTSVWTTIFASLHVLCLMIRIRPQVILCIGRGTCIPLCVIAFLFKVYIHTCEIYHSSFWMAFNGPVFWM